MKALIKKGTILLSIILAVIPTLLFGQINFNGRMENIIGSEKGLSLRSEDSGTTIQIKDVNGKAQVVFENHLYTISEKKGFIVDDSTGKEILRTDKKIKFYFTSDGDTLYSENFKGWDICLADKEGNVMIKGKYTVEGNDSKISVEAMKPDISAIALVGYQLINKSRTLAQTNEWLLILSSL